MTRRAFIALERPVGMVIRLSYLRHCHRQNRCQPRQWSRLELRVSPMNAIERKFSLARCRFTLEDRPGRPETAEYDYRELGRFASLEKAVGIFVRGRVNCHSPMCNCTSGMRQPNSGLPEFGNIIVQVGYSRLGWRRPGIHNHKSGLWIPGSRLRRIRGASLACYGRARPRL